MQEYLNEIQDIILSDIKNIQKHQKETSELDYQNARKLIEYSKFLFKKDKDTKDNSNLNYSEEETRAVILSEFKNIFKNLPEAEKQELLQSLTAEETK